MRFCSRFVVLVFLHYSKTSKSTCSTTEIFTVFVQIFQLIAGISSIVNTKRVKTKPKSKCFCRNRGLFSHFFRVFKSNPCKCYCCCRSCCFPTARFSSSASHCLTLGDFTKIGNKSTVQVEGVHLFTVGVQIKPYKVYF